MAGIDSHCGSGCRLLALPLPLLEAIIHKCSSHVRLVCKQLLAAHDCGGTQERHLHTYPGLCRCAGWEASPLVDIPRHLLSQQTGRALHQLTIHMHRLGAEAVQELVQLLRTGAVSLAGLQQLTVLGFQAPNVQCASEVAEAVLGVPGGCSNLRTLRVSSGATNNQGGATLAEALLRATQLSLLRCLDLSDHRRQPYDHGPSWGASVAGTLAHASHLSSLEELNLSSCGYILPVATAALASGNFPKLRALDLNRCLFSTEQLLVLLQALRSAPHASFLRELRLGCGADNASSTGDTVMAALLRDTAQWQPLSRLTTLELTGFGLTGSSMDALAMAVTRDGSLQALQRLCLERCHLSNDSALQLAGCLQHLPALRSLALPRNDISDEGAAALAGALAGVPHLAATLELLNLSYNYTQVQGQGVVALAAALHAGAGAGLRSLQLAGSRISNVGGRVLCAALLACTHLSRLTSLAVDSDHDEFPAPRIAAAAVQGRHSKSLEELRVRGVAVGCTDMRGHRDALALVGALAGATHLAGLRVLQLQGIGLGDRGMARLCAALASGACAHLAGLRVLILSLNCISDAGAAALAALLVAAPAALAGLQQLSLADNAITHVGFSLLGDAFRQARQLRSLSCLDLQLDPYSRSRGGIQDADVMVAALRDNPFLPHLWALRLGGWYTGRGHEPFLRQACVTDELLAEPLMTW